MGYIAALIIYAFFPSIKIQGKVLDQNNTPLANVKISVDYREYQVDVMEEASAETTTKADGSFRIKLKKSGTEYPINVFVISGKDTLVSKTIPEGRKKLNILLEAEEKK